MKPSEYAKQQGSSYRTAFRWWQAGQLPGDQAATGTLIVQDPKTAAAAAQRVAIYARVCSHEPQATVDRQAERLVSYCLRGQRLAGEQRRQGDGVRRA